MDLKQIGSAASLDETAIHINKMASCSVDAASVQLYARNCKKHLAYFSHVVYNTFI